MHCDKRLYRYLRHETAAHFLDSNFALFRICLKLEVSRSILWGIKIGMKFPFLPHHYHATPHPPPRYIASVHSSRNCRGSQIHYKNWLAWGFWHAPAHPLAIFVACSSSWSWSWSWARPAGVPTEGLGRGAANKGGWSPQDPDPKSFHRTIWPFLWPNW